MKILIIYPPCIPTYFNAGHHLPIFIIGNYIRSKINNVFIHCIDAGALNFSWKDIAMMLMETSFDIITIMNEFGTIDSVSRMIDYCKQLSPHSKLITFGRLSYQIPDFFKKYQLDGIVYSGDYEAGVFNYLQFILGNDDNCLGLYIFNESRWIKYPEGIFLQPEEWVFPDIHEIPYGAYTNLYLDDSKKFCGIPERKELVVLVARGCPIKCSFCEVSRQQGQYERRRSVSSVIKYIEDSFAKIDFEYVSMYAPTFTLNHDWVKDFCNELIKRGSIYPWKCVTTLFHLDEEIVKLMGESKCVRISIGLETLDEASQLLLPKIKQKTLEKLKNISIKCQELGIELNCFIILGLPGQNLEGVINTLEAVESLGARIRPTIYTPYHELSADMDEQTILKYDRQFFISDLFSQQEKERLYKLAFVNYKKATKIMDKIPKK